MKIRHTIVCGVLAVILALTFTACTKEDDPGEGGPTNWTAVSDSIFPTTNSGGQYADGINAIAYGSNRFVAVDTFGNRGYSTNGESWTAADDRFQSWIFSIAYGNNRFVAAGDGIMEYSDDGASWTAVTNSTFGTFTRIIAIAYGNNRFVAAGDSGKMAYSDDNGVTWTAVSNSTFGTSDIRAIAYGNKRFVATSTNGKMAYCDW